MMDVDRRFEAERYRSSRMPEQSRRSHDRDDRERRYEEPIRESSRDRRDHQKIPSNSNRSDYPSAERTALAERDHFRHHTDEPMQPSELPKEESEDGDRKRKDKKKRKRKADSGEESDVENSSKKKKKKAKKIKSKSKDDIDSNNIEDHSETTKDPDAHKISPKHVESREKPAKSEVGDDQQIPPENDALAISTKIEGLSDPISEGELEDKMEDPTSKWDLVHTDDDEGKEDPRSDLRALLKTKPKDGDLEPPVSATNEDEEEEEDEDAMTGDKSDEDKSSKKKKKKKKTKKKSKGHHSGSDSDDGSKKKKKKKKEKKYAELKKELMLLRQKIGETHSDRSPSPPSERTPPAIHDYDNIKVTIARSPSRSRGRREPTRDRPQRSLSPVIASKLMELSGTKILDEPPRRKSVKDRLGPIPAKKPESSSSRGSRGVQEGSASRKTRSPERWEPTRQRTGSRDLHEGGRKAREEPPLVRPHKRSSADMESSRSRRETEKSSSKSGKAASPPPRRRESPKSSIRSSKSARNLNSNGKSSRHSPERRRRRDESKSRSNQPITKLRDKRRDPKDEETKQSFKQRESVKNEQDGNDQTQSPLRDSRKNARLERNRSRFEDEANFEPDYEGDSE